MDDIAKLIKSLVFPLFIVSTLVFAGIACSHDAKFEGGKVQQQATKTEPDTESNEVEVTDTTLEGAPSSENANPADKPGKAPANSENSDEGGAINSVNDGDQNTEDLESRNDAGANQGKDDSIAGTPDIESINDGEVNADPFDKCGLTDQETVNLKLPGSISQCFEQNTLFNFTTKTCATNATINTNFACTFDNIKEKMIELGINGAAIERVMKWNTEGSKLLGCSIKNNGDTLIFQHWAPTDTMNTCDIRGKIFGTACYKFSLDGSLPDLSIPEKMEAFVQLCLNE